MPKQIINNKPLHLLLFFIFCVTGTYAQINYPFARQQNFDTVIYNQKLSDQYAWMSRPENETEMLAWAKAQGNFTDSLLDKISGDEKLYPIIEKLMQPNDDEIIVKGIQGNNLYYLKMMPDKKRWLMKQQGINGISEKITALPYTIHQYRAKKYAFAHTKPLLAIMLVAAGEANPHIRFFDLGKKEFLQDSIGPVMFNDASGVSMAWLPDDSGIIYSQAPSENTEAENYYRGKLKLHIVNGNSQQKDEALFGKGVIAGIALQDYDVPYIYSFTLSPYIIARVRAGKGDNYAYAVHYSKLNAAKTPWKKLQGYTCNDGTFTAKDNFIYAVSEDVPNMQLIKVNVATGEKPILFLREQSQILETIAAGKDALYVKYTAPGKDGILKMGYDKPAPVDVPMPFDGAVDGLKIIGDNELLFGITNWIRNNEYHIVSHPLNQVSLLSGAGNPDSFFETFTSKVIYVSSRDGVQIPVSLVYSKEIVLGQKPLPLLIDAYGCFGTSMAPAFLPDIFIWLSQGGIFAEAHIRGGGELGAAWFKSGSYPTKMNSINDIEDVAEYFVKNNYTQPTQQAITGGSCGSLNVGLATLHRPDLFCAGVYEVGIPDLVTNKGASFGKGQNEFGPLDTEDGFK